MDIQSTVKLRSGNKMPIMGLGTWQLTENTASTIVKALQLGYRMIDTSGDYGTQPGVGEGIKNSGVARDAIYLVTKIEEDDDAYDAARKNLKELQLDYADLILIHRPPPTEAGEDLWKGLIRARKDGLTKDIGVSNYSIERIRALIKATDEVPAVNQIEWSAFGYSQDMLNYCQENNIIIQAYSPLTRTERLDDDVLQEVSAKYGKTPAQILIRWCLQVGTVPLPKANNEEHLKQNIDVFDFEISRADMDKLNGLNEKYSSLSSCPEYMSS
jgi:2,5-diketo-D-gluconate reductase A